MWDLKKRNRYSISKGSILLRRRRSTTSLSATTSCAWVWGRTPCWGKWHNQTHHANGHYVVCSLDWLSWTWCFVFTVIRTHFLVWLISGRSLANLLHQTLQTLHVSDISWNIHVCLAGFDHWTFCILNKKLFISWGIWQFHWESTEQFSSVSHLWVIFVQICGECFLFFPPHMSES